MTGILIVISLFIFFLNQNKSWTEENKPGDIETSECLDFFFLWSNNFINDTIVNDESKKIVKETTSLFFVCLATEKEDDVII